MWIDMKKFADDRVLIVQDNDDFEFFDILLAYIQLLSVELLRLPFSKVPFQYRGNENSE